MGRPMVIEGRHAEALALHASGATDPEIAAALGVSRKAVGDWRCRHKLPRVVLGRPKAIKEPPPPPSVVEHLLRQQIGFLSSRLRHAKRALRAWVDYDHTCLPAGNAPARIRAKRLTTEVLCKGMDSGKPIEDVA